jgi:imidazolonepropionase-like amidohydrolase
LRDAPEPRRSVDLTEAAAGCSGQFRVRGTDHCLFGEQVIVGHNGEVLRDAVVVVRDGLIVTVAPVGLLRSTIEAQGGPSGWYKTLLPGLIDPHVHLGFRLGQPLTQPEPAMEDQQVSGAVETLGRLLAQGVTTVRDLGCPEPLFARIRDEVRQDPLAWPRLVGSSRPITSKGGHLSSFGRAVSTTRQARAAVAACIDDGAGVIKVVVTGGALTPGTAMGRSSFDHTLLETVVEAAHEAGRTVAAHVHGTEGIALAVRSGVDTLEHCSWTDTTRRIRRPLVAVLEEIITRGQVIVTAGPLPSPMVQWLGDPAGSWEAVAQLRRTRRQLALWRNARAARMAGAYVAIGTDSLFGAFDDDSDLLARAVLMVRVAQWEPLEVIEAVTGLAGKAVDAHGRFGVLVPGAPADVVALDGDPLRNIEHLKSVSFVMRGGRVVRELSGKPG